MRGIWIRWMIAAWLLGAGPSRAVLFYSTDDPAYNTNAPAGSLDGSGWQFQGRFEVSASDGYLGTPVSPHHFITAGHLPSANVGDIFHYEGRTYTTVSNVADSLSDLMLWEVDGAFEQYAPLYTGSGEASKECVVFGRGTRRGAAVTANGAVKGWAWGARDYVMRWGQNRVEAVTTLNGYPVLQADFDSTGGTNECMLSDKDSGGALFIQDEGTWKLAGIHYAVIPSTFSYSSDGADSFNAALFDYSFRPGDAEKLYYYNGSWTYFNSTGEDPCRFFSSRISARYDWITNNIPDFDRDVDGLPDGWEILYAGDATAMDPELDQDGDGFVNYAEWVADTVPTDPASFFRMHVLRDAPAILFTGSSNREYQVQYRLDLLDTNETWQMETDWFAGTYPETTNPVTAATSNRFYRVRARVR